MSGVEWLAAVLNPSDVAPHPNFIESEELTPQGLLALLIELRWTDYERIVGGDESTKSQQQQLARVKSSHEMRIVVAARQSLVAESQRLGLEALVQLGANPQLDLGPRVAACLVACVGLSELDECDRALNLLTSCHSSLADLETSDSLLLRSALLQQLALRSSEVGSDGREYARQCLKSLDMIRSKDLSRFPTSRGVGWTSARTLGQVREQLHGIADAFIVNADSTQFVTKDWMRFVRSPASVLNLRTERHAATATWAYVEEMFDQHLNSTKRTVFNQDPVEKGLGNVLLHAELMGDLSACRLWRSRVGMTRMLRGADDSTWYVREALRLFRQAEDVGRLDLTLRTVRSGGPLESVALEARQIVAQRLAPERLRTAELAVLAAAAPFMDAELASRGLDGVLDALGAELPAPTRSWQLYAVRAERAWLAAVALGATAQRLDVVSDALRAAAESAEPGDELLRGAIVRAAGSIDWNGVPTEVRADWADWLTQTGHAVGADLREAIGPDLGIEPSQILDEEMKLGDIPSLLNQTIIKGDVPSPERVVEAAQLALAALSRIRSSAAVGQFSVGRTSPSEIAAGLGLYWGADIVWAPLADFIRDAVVDPGDKAPALSRLARPDSEPPESFVREVGSNVESLLRATSIDIFQQTRRINAEALRFCIRHGLLSEQSTVVELSTMGVATATEERVQAARCLGLLAELDSINEWAVVLAFQLSMDPEPLVRAESGRTLGLFSKMTPGYDRLVNDRISELLSEDGLVVPLLVLRGLGSGRPERPLSPSLRRRIDTIAASHVAYGVRLQASALLEHEKSSTDG